MPEGAQAVIIAHGQGSQTSAITCPDMLSHSAVRARKTLSINLDLASHGYMNSRWSNQCVLLS